MGCRLFKEMNECTVAIHAARVACKGADDKERCMREHGVFDKAPTCNATSCAIDGYDQKLYICSASPAGEQRVSGMPRFGNPSRVFVNP